MALTADSTISEVLKSRPDAKEIIAKHAGQPVDESQLAMAMSMSLRQVAGFIGWGSDKIEAVLKDLNVFSHGLHSESPGRHRWVSCPSCQCVSHPGPWSLV